MKRLRLSNLLWILPGGIALALGWLLPRHPAVAEKVFAEGLFRLIAVPMGWLTSLIPLSLTELALILALPAAVLLAVRLVRRLRRGGRRRAIARLLRTAAWLVSILFAVYMVMHGLNFARPPVSELMGLDTRPQTVEYLAAVCRDLAKQASAERARLPEDENGRIRDERSTVDLLRQAETGFRAAGRDCDLLWGGTWQPKPVRLSHWWSYTGITGMYFPFFAEANVNVDVPVFDIPFTAAHELAHTRGFAREDECNFIAWLTCLYQDDPLYRYSGQLMAYLYCENALKAYDNDLRWQIRDTCSEAVQRDLQLQHDYWAAFEGEVQQVSTEVNDAFLTVQGEEDGVFSYDRVVALIMAYYQTKIWP
ncbi:MAG: DUF3810 domain-containing protein [Acutalibacteraceae bacterium]